MRVWKSTSALWACLHGECRLGVTVSIDLCHGALFKVAGRPLLLRICMTSLYTEQAQARMQGLSKPLWDRFRHCVLSGRTELTSSGLRYMESTSPSPRDVQWLSDMRAPRHACIGRRGLPHSTHAPFVLPGSCLSSVRVKLPSDP